MIVQIPPFVNHTIFHQGVCSQILLFSKISALAFRQRRFGLPWLLFRKQKGRLQRFFESFLSLDGKNFTPFFL